MSNIQEPVLIKDLGMQYPSVTSKRKRRYGEYQCSCGMKFKAGIGDVKNGTTSSCGCYNKSQSGKSNTIHGFINHPLYKTHSAMVRRVSDPKDKHFEDYGGRGITICERWMNIINFIEDMYPSYQKGLSIDRINNDGNYEFSNCRWTTRNVQARNTRVLMITNTSGYRGVSWDKQKGCWRVRITVDSKSIYLGHFNDLYEAAQAYDKYVVAHCLEHSRNFTTGEELPQC